MIVLCREVETLSAVFVIIVSPCVRYPSVIANPEKTICKNVITSLIKANVPSNCFAVSSGVDSPYHIDMNSAKTVGRDCVITLSQQVPKASSIVQVFLSPKQ